MHVIFVSLSSVLRSRIIKKDAIRIGKKGVEIAKKKLKTKKEKRKTHVCLQQRPPYLAHRALDVLRRELAVYADRVPRFGQGAG